MWRVTEAPCLENVAYVFVLFLCGVQLVIRSGVLIVLDLDEVDVTPRFAEVFGSVVSGVGGSAGGWRCCWGAPSLPQLPPATPKNPPPCSSVLFSCFGEVGVTNTKSGRLEVNLSLSEKRGGKSHLGTILLSAVSGIWRFCMVICSLLPISMEKTHDPKEPACFADSLKDHAACQVVYFVDLVPYLRVLAPRKDMQGIVYLWAKGAVTPNCWL